MTTYLVIIGVILATGLIGYFVWAKWFRKPDKPGKKGPPRRASTGGSIDYGNHPYPDEKGKPLINIKPGLPKKGRARIDDFFKGDLSDAAHQLSGFGF